jgi:hypothetical protein
MDEKRYGGNVFDLIEGLTPVDPSAFEDFRREMTTEIIPQIVKIVEERRLLAAKSTNWQLKC